LKKSFDGSKIQAFLPISDAARRQYSIKKQILSGIVEFKTPPNKRN
jgi:hypothetical protein